MSTITLAISDEVKDKMRQFPEINWSGLVRKMIEEKVKQLTWKEEILKKIDREREFTEWSVEMGRKAKKGIAKKLKKEGLLK